MCTADRIGPILHLASRISRPSLFSMTPSFIAVSFAAVASIGMAVFLEIGRRVGERRLAQDPEGARVGIGALEGSVFGLLGLLIAFTFSGAAARFDDRRALVSEEANAIGTAWLRLDLLAPPARAGLQDQFRSYLDSRIATYRLLPDVDAARAELARSLEMQGRIWSSAVAAARDTGTPSAQTLILPALNDMFDIVTTRMESMYRHPPKTVFGMLGVLSLIASLMAGYGMAGARTRSWIHIAGFVIVMTATIYVIMDMEFPRFGIIRVDGSDQVLVDLRASMK